MPVARWLTMASRPSALTAIWATGLVRIISLRSCAASSDNIARDAGRHAVPKPAPSATSERTRRKNRRLRSMGSKTEEWLSSISALPRNNTPLGRSANASRPRIRDWVSALKYIRVLRQSRMSIREIGASRVRSLRPKITLRRSSGVNRYRPPTRSK